MERTRLAPVVTGVATISAAGVGPAALLEALDAGRPLSRVDSTGRPVAGIDDFDPARHVAQKGLKHLSRTSQLAVATAAGLDTALAGRRTDEVGVVLGTAWATLDAVVRFEREAHLEGVRFVDPLLFIETVANVPAGQASIAFGWSALNVTVADGQGSGLAALHLARALIAEGRAPAIVAGGADAFHRHLVRVLHGGTSPMAPQGEGCGLLVLEDPQGAADRGAAVLGSLVASTSQTRGAGPRGADVQALEGAAATGLCRWLAETGGAAAVDVLVVSATGCRDMDGAEAALVHALFGTNPPPAIAPRAVLGQVWAAGGPLGLVAAIEVLRRGCVPAGPAGFEEPERFGLGSAPATGAFRRALVIEVASARIDAVLVDSGVGR